MHMLNIVLWGRQRQILNGYSSVNNGNNFKFLNAKKKLTPEMMYLKMIRLCERLVREYWPGVQNTSCCYINGPIQESAQYPRAP